MLIRITMRIKEFLKEFLQLREAQLIYQDSDDFQFFADFLI